MMSKKKIIFSTYNKKMILFEFISFKMIIFAKSILFKVNLKKTYKIKKIGGDSLIFLCNCDINLK